MRLPIDDRTLFYPRDRSDIESVSGFGIEEERRRQRRV